MANERYSHPSDYVGTRTKGRRAGTMWYSERSEEGDITLFEYFDLMPPICRVEMITDWIGMLQRELEVQRAMIEKEIADLFDMPEANQ